MLPALNVWNLQKPNWKCLLLPFCPAIICKSTLNLDPHATLSSLETTFQRIIKHTCDPGYSFDPLIAKDNVQQRRCMANGRLFPETTPLCRCKNVLQSLGDNSQVNSDFKPLNTFFVAALLIHAHKHTHTHTHTLPETCM